MVYSRFSRWLHWLTASWVLTMLTLGIMLGNSRTLGLSTRFVFGTLEPLHYTLGVLGIALLALRIIWRIKEGFLPADPHHPLIERIAARSAQLLMLVLTSVLVIAGLMSAGLYGDPIKLLFGLQLPALGDNGDLAELAYTVHWWTSKLLAVTILAHFGGAMKHWLIDKDDTMKRITG